MSKWYSAIEKIWNGHDHYINREVVDGEIRETWATEIRGHNVCVVRNNQDNNDVNVWVDTTGRHTTLDQVDSYIRRLLNY